jgi:hypothetical protein
MEAQTQLLVRLEVQVLAMEAVVAVPALLEATVALPVVAVVAVVLILLVALAVMHKFQFGYMDRNNYG